MVKGRKWTGREESGSERERLEVKGRGRERKE